MIFYLLFSCKIKAMEMLKENQPASKLELDKLKHLKVKTMNEEFVASIVDGSGYEALIGYGKTAEEAINDLHHNLI
jgi:hypothetical protein